jgi:thioredoxin-related protein
MGEDEMKYLSLFLILVLVLSACSTNNVPQEKIESLAKCLSEKDVVMYGAFWCPHCARSKKNFGPSFQYIKYVECDPRGDNEQSELCLEKKIENYDTWEFASGERVVGEPSFEVLAEKSGCAWSAE